MNNNEAPIQADLLALSPSSEGLPHEPTKEYGGPSDDPLLQAMYRVVHRYPGGVESVAKQLNRTSKYLTKAVSGLPGAKLSIDDAQAITQITGDLEMLEVMASELGFHLVKLPPPTSASDDFAVHAENVLKQMGRCMTFGAPSSCNLRLRVTALMHIGAYIQEAEPLGNADSISPNQYKKLVVAFLKIDQAAFTGELFHLQMHADLQASFKALERKVPARLR